MMEKEADLLNLGICGDGIRVNVVFFFFLRERSSPKENKSEIR